MKTEGVRAFLALAVVGVFMTITGFMAIFPLLMPSNVELGPYADFFAKTASVYTGIVGVIVGYYFGRADTNRSQATGKGSKTEPSAPGGPTE